MNFIDGKATFAGGTFNTNNIDNVAYVTVAVAKENKNKVQIEEGNAATSCVPHEENTQTTYLKEPLCGLNGVYDELDYSKGKIIRRFGKKVFDGTENWNLYNISEEKKQYYITVNNYKYSETEITTMSNYFVGDIINNRTKNNNTVYTTSNGIAFRCDNFATLEEWKAFLAEQYANGTPVEIVYELATPIIEHIDCSNKIAQFDGQTNIYNTDGAELECTLTNNTAIAQINQNLQKIEDMIFSIKAGGE